MIDKWGFSENEENWSGVEFCYDTKEEAIAAGEKEAFKKFLTRNNQWPVAAVPGHKAERKKAPKAALFKQEDLDPRWKQYKSGDTGGTIAGTAGTK